MSENEQWGEERRLLLIRHTHPSEPEWLRTASCFAALVEDARFLSRRDAYGQETRSLQERSGQQLWLSSLAYLVLLDQIGSSLRPAGGATLQYTSGFRLGVGYFVRRVRPQLSDRDADSLYALRCSFAHNYALVNAPRTGGERMARVFKLDWSSSKPLIADAGPETVVNLYALEELIEKVIMDVQYLAIQGELRFADGLDESSFLHRFSMVLTPGTS